MSRNHEVPPTAGLPPVWRDLLPSGAEANLALRAADFLAIDSVQLECSGTAALVVALTTLQRLRGRRTVIVPAYTCPLVALAIAHCGLELRLCDLAPGSIDFDKVQLAALCDDKTLAVIPTHLGGRVTDVPSAMAIAQQAGAYVIEDAAQGLGARRAGRAVGLDGDIGFFSLAVGKGLTTYEGGLLVARDSAMRAELAYTSREIIPQRAGWELKRTLQLLGYHALYRPSLLRLAYGLPLRRALRNGDLVAAVGDDFAVPIPLHPLGQWRQSVGARSFHRLPAFLAVTAAQAQVRKTRLAQIDGIVVIDDPPDTHGTWPFLIVQLRDGERRDSALHRLWTAGVGMSRLFIHALPDYDYLEAVVGTAHDVPNARNFAATTLTISNSPWLGDDQFGLICAVLESIG